MSGQLVNTRQLVTAVYVVIIAGLGLGAAALFNDAYQEYTRLKQNEASLQRKLADAQTRLAEQEKILERLKTDPEYVKKVLQKRLNYVKPEQQVFDFRSSETEVDEFRRAPRESDRAPRETLDLSRPAAK